MRDTLETLVRIKNIIGLCAFVYLFILLMPFALISPLLAGTPITADVLAAAIEAWVLGFVENIFRIILLMFVVILTLGPGAGGLLFGSDVPEPRF